MSRPPKPTEAELEILSVLWEENPATVRRVHDLLAARGRESGYTTVLKLMQIMVGKGLLERDESRRTHSYTPARTPRVTRKALVDDLMQRAFSGSAAQLALHALSARKASPEEIDEIRRLLDSMEEKGRGK